MITLYKIASLSYDVILSGVTLYAIWRFRTLTLPGKMMCLLIWNGFLTEWLGAYTARYYGTNLPVYNLSTLTEYFIICLFFNYSLLGFRGKHIGIYIGTAGVLAGIGNTLKFQPLAQINSNFIFLECLTVVCLTLFLTFRMLIALDVVPSREIYFWFASVLLFYHTSTLWIWAIYDYVYHQSGAQGSLVLEYSLMVVGIITYSAYALLLYLYPKLKRSYV